MGWFFCEGKTSEEQEASKDSAHGERLLSQNSLETLRPTTRGEPTTPGTPVKLLTREV